jgi:hypothetical protein
MEKYNYKDVQKSDHKDEVGFWWWENKKNYNAYHYEYKNGVRSHHFWQLKDVYTAEPTKQSLWQRIRSWLE